MRINECSIGISRLKWNVIKSYEGLLGDTTKFPHNEAAGQLKWLKTPLRQSGAGVFFLSPTCQMPHRIVYLAHNIPSRCVQ